MSFILEDGTGSGKKLKINNDNRLEADAVISGEEHHENEDNQKSWNVAFDALDPTCTDDYFLNLKNTSEAVRALSRIVITSTVAGYVEVQRVTGTSVGGAAEQVNSFTFGGADPSCFTAESAVNITGLVDAGVLRFIWLPANVTQFVEFEPTIRLLQNEQAALLWTTCTGILTGTIDFYEEG